jgi:SAM-dependent methyltransferase
MPDRPFSKYADRNCEPILEVLRIEFANRTSVLEIGSGTGQHAARFAKELSYLRWQTSDLDENHDGINAWVESSGLKNLLPPLSLDVLTATSREASCDAAYSANTAHIMSIDGVKRMFEIIAGSLTADGTFCLYGPFRQGGVFNTTSNEAFHKSLRSRNGRMGIRHIESLDEFGGDNGLTRTRLFAMPANNHLAVWQKGDL